MAIKGLSDTTAAKLYELTQPKDKKKEKELRQPAKALSGKYTKRRDELLESYLEREPYDFNINTDKLYSQYADLYKKQGEAAMRDTISQAADKTGGYGSSYGVTAGAQAYQGYLDRLNAIVPELEHNAYERYRAEGDNALNKLEILDALDTKEYQKRRDEYADYKDLRDYYRKVYEYENDYDYDMYKALTDYVLSIAELENDSRLREGEQKIALASKLYK